MSRNNPYFTVFGGSYLPENHTAQGFNVERPIKRNNGPVWLAVSGVVAGISAFAAEFAWHAGSALW